MINLHGADRFSMRALMDANSFKDPPFIASFFIKVEITAMPGISHWRIGPKQKSHIIDFAPGVASVGVQFNSVVERAMVGRAPLEV